MWRDAALVAGKDLRVEARSRVGVNQVAPFALLVLMLFAFALDPDRATLARVDARASSGSPCSSPALLAIQRSFVIEAARRCPRRPAAVGARRRPASSWARPRPIAVAAPRPGGPSWPWAWSSSTA